MYNIKSICKYDCSYDLLWDTFGPDLFDDLTDDERDFLRSVDDFESVALFLLNGETVIVCDSLTGDTNGHPLTLDEFRDNLLDMVHDNAE